MLCITFDNFGCGADFGHGQGKMPPQMRPDEVPVSEWDNVNEIGLTVGQPRMLALLERLQIPTTFYAEGYSAVLHPVEMRRWVDQGHEIALHGWKHETWANVSSKECEENLVSLGMAAMTELLGDQAPVGFRPPGFMINPWTEDILEKHGIKYISVVGKRDQGHTDALDKLGIKYADSGAQVPITRLKRSLCNDYLTDAFLVSPEHGGLVGTADDEAGYGIAYESALAHERATPNEPWVFVAHPMISGNRAWFGFKKFMTRLHAEFGSANFRTIREVALGN
jgi:peptidoglycan/xylan/chitin deacetylase (PgdA/CDA1 family)